jgi:hypothetical protein
LATDGQHVLATAWLEGSQGAGGDPRTILAVVDGARPADGLPTLGSFALNGAATGLAFLGPGFAVVPAADVGTYILDVRDPAMIAVASLLPAESGTTFTGVTAGGGHVYLVDSGGSRIFVMTLDDQGQPTIVSIINGVRYANEVVVSNSRLYVAHSDGIGIYDVRDPRRPVALASVGAPGPVEHLAVADHQVFMAGLHRSRNPVSYYELALVDATDPQQIAPQWRFSVTGSGDLALVGKHLVLTTDEGDGYGSGSLRPGGPPAAVVYDTSTAPAAEAAVLTSSGAIDSLVGGQRGFLYLLRARHAARVATLSDPAQPRAAGALLAIATDTVAAADHLLAWLDRDRELVISDVSDPLLPQTIATIDLGGLRPHSIRLSSMFAAANDSEGTTFLGGWPGNPRQVGSLAKQSTLGIAGNVAFVAAANGLTAYSLDVENGVRELDHVDIGLPFVVALDENRAVVGVRHGPASASTQLTVLDISDPSDMRVLGSADVLGNVRTVSISGDLAVVSVSGVPGGNAATTDVLFSDISDPSQPVLAGSLGSAGTNVRDALLVGDMLYVAKGDLGLETFALRRAARAAAAQW